MCLPKRRYTAVDFRAPELWLGEKLTSLRLTVNGLFFNAYTKYYLITGNKCLFINPVTPDAVS